MAHILILPLDLIISSWAFSPPTIRSSTESGTVRSCHVSLVLFNLHPIFVKSINNSVYLGGILFWTAHIHINTSHIIFSEKKKNMSRKGSKYSSWGKKVESKVWSVFMNPLPCPYPWNTPTLCGRSQKKNKTKKNCLQNVQLCPLSRAQEEHNVLPHIQKASCRGLSYSRVILDNSNTKWQPHWTWFQSSSSD